MGRIQLGVMALFVLSGLTACVTPTANQAGLIHSGFLFESAPFPSVHASSLVETDAGLLVAWFGGTAEGNEDVGIWLSRQQDGAWTEPVEVANGVQANGTRYPTWNPVLFAADDGEITLFYKVGPSPREWWGSVLKSSDDGRSWSDPERLPEGILGPIKNKPVRLGDGTLISSSSTESNTRPSSWRVHFERSTDNGENWTIIRPASVDTGEEVHAIQPSILIHADGRLQAVGRSRSDYIFQTWSDDNGLSWSPVTLTALPNPSSGTDALTLQDGRHLIVYNHTPRGRSPLNVAISADGENWQAALVLENETGEYSYPAVIQTTDGLVHITYTWRRDLIKHVVIDPHELQLMPISVWE
ncbi:MAG: exo-alpha-sialidase [Gammaproteobacteria bacterium]|nr:exo-alpha-sialidase [Gammaproteobacteria bacterium]